MHSLVIKGGTVIDGTGAPPTSFDVAIDATRIAGMCKSSHAEALTTIDARGMIVCPGFIDIHSHSELPLLSNPLAESKIRQGVTTELVGNCGASPAPLIGAAKDALADEASLLDVKVDWATLDEYFLRLSNLKTSVNVATLVGAETLRCGVIGASDVKADAAQIERMSRLLAESIFQGAFGLSSGLIYAPGCYASTEELISLASTSASLGGMYASHIRGEGRTLLEAVAEAIRIGREAHVRVQISHHKACGSSNWGKVHETIKMIEEARAEGIDVAFDVYPYTASSTSLDTILPPWARDGGKGAILARLRDASARARIRDDLGHPATNWENIVAEIGWDRVVLIGFTKDANRRFENKSVARIAQDQDKDPAETALDLLADEELHVAAILHEICEDDVIAVMEHPLACIGSDGVAEAPYGPSGSSATHPRSYGTFPRVIRRYSIEKGLFPLEEAIRKMTSWPAQRMGLSDRGVLAKGLAADLVMFDAEKVRDLATFENPHRYPEGIRYVVINGTVTIEDGEHTKARAGQVLRYRPSVAQDCRFLPRKLDAAR